MRSTVQAAFTIVALSGVLGINRPAHAQVAVVVPRSSPTTDLSLDDLRRLFLGQTTTYGPGVRATLVECATARTEFYQAVAKMSLAQVDRAWLAVVFQGGNATPPRRLPNADEVKRYVAEHPGAIGFIPAAAADASIKVLTINGSTPIQPGYPIR